MADGPTGDGATEVDEDLAGGAAEGVERKSVMDAQPVLSNKLK